jgi:hypothetical protein
MPRIKRRLPSAEYQELRKSASEHNERGDCMVKALALLTDLPYATVRQALLDAGRKPRGGTNWWVAKRALKPLASA